MMGIAKSVAKAVALAAVVSVVLSEPLRSGEQEPQTFIRPKQHALVEPQDQQVHIYTAHAEQSPHIARGDGLHAATTGVPTSFTIELVGDNDQLAVTKSEKFIYVWIASEDQIFIAEVTDDDGGGTLTATYESSFPGHYLVYIEEVDVARNDEGRPIAGSPFSLTITGAPMLDVDNLPLCGTDETEDIEVSFWRPGTWLSSRLASAAHGVTRYGWVFQPKTCVHDTFTYEDLMILASLQEETWILVLGGSVQRGLFLSLVDMALAQGQKDNFSRSILAKCWGYANVKIGNLRLTYQDFRLYTTDKLEDLVVCNNEKLASGSNGAYVGSSRQFLASTVFKSGITWPSAILAPSNIQPKHRPNLPIMVLKEALPPNWTGKLLMVDHMAGLGFHWTAQNPTATALRTAGMEYHSQPSLGDDELSQMRRHHNNDTRIEFVSAFPVYQAKLFENQNTQGGIRKYGSSVHYHYISRHASSTETNNGQRMVQSTVTEMLANILITKAVGSKAQLHKRAEAAQDTLFLSRIFGSSFEIEHDCPASLVPFHVKPLPEPTRITVDSLPVDTQTYEVWDKELCPAWCMAEDPVSQTPTESGPVDVRECGHS